MSTYQYDNEAVHAVLMQRLQGKHRKPFSLSLCIDAEQFAGQVPKQQKPRLKDLKAEGAQIYICKGMERGGSHHWKGAVLDRRLWFTGGLNLTEKSLRNTEMCMQMTGAVVQQAVDALAVAQQRGVLWQ